MAIKKIKGANTDTPANYGEWLIDNDSDISSLPTSKDKKNTDDIASIGSLAYSIESNKIYMLNNSDSWGDATKLLKGTDLEDVKKEVAKQIAAIVADAPEQFDTLKEIADWIEGHNVSVDGINAKIDANEKAIKQNTTDIETNKSNIEKNTKDISTKQSKLTAGENITISDDNTISAKGYDDASLKAEVNKKQNKLVAGSNITIDESTNTISSKDTIYDDTEIKKNKQDKLIAGENITILSDGKTLNAVDTKYTLSSDGTTITLTGTDGSEQSISDNHVTVDSSLSSTSTNPVQNKVINSALSGKQDKGDYATKSEVTAEVNTQIAKVVANAPEDFDTLKEIADWIDKHEDSAAAMNTQIKDVSDKAASLETSKQDKLTAGENVTIDANNKISATDTDTKYGLGISGSTVSLVENGSTKSVTVPSNYHKINYITTGGTNGESKEGYINFAQIKITGSYADAPISFEVTSRRGLMARIFVCFNGGKTSDPTLNTSMTYVLSYNKTVYSEFYIIKAATSTWNLWYKKIQAWDHINVTDMYHAQDTAGETGNLTVTFPGAFSASAISGWAKLDTHFGLLTAGTNVTISDGVISSTNTDTTYKDGEGINLNGTTFSIDPNKVYSANHANWISNAMDWNTLIQPGSYKVQMASWGDASTYHSPNGTNKDIYSFGMLFVIAPDNEDLGYGTVRENRLVQIYMPHDHIASVHIYKQWWYRYHNGTKMSKGWSAWAPIGMFYSAGAGISMSDSGYNRVITNSGVRSIGTGTTNGTISVNTNGTTANVAVKGLASTNTAGSASVPVYVTGGNFANTTSTQYGEYAHGTDGYYVYKDTTVNCRLRNGGNDYAGLDKLNNVDIQTWYGFSVSNGLNNSNKVAFSVNARTGDTYTRYLKVANSIEGHITVPVTKDGKGGSTKSVLRIYGPTYGNDAQYLTTAGKLTYGDPGPQIQFGTKESDTNHSGALIFTDHDAVAPGASLTFTTNQPDGYFIAPHIKANLGFVSDKYRNDGDYGTSFIKARDTALFGSTLTPTTSATYSPVLSVKTTTGNFTIGSYYNYGDSLVITHDTDANYKANKDYANQWTLSNTGEWSGSARSATNDSEGNKISETYAKVVEGAITAGTNSSYVKLKLKKISNIVYLYGSFTIEKLSSTGVAANVFTLPNGFQAAYAKSATTYANDLTTPMFLQGLQDGNVTITMTGLEEGTAYTISASWIALDPKFN